MSQESVTERIWRRAYETCIPLGATVEVTLRCNLRCVHCYNFDRGEPRRRPDDGQELTPSEILGVLDQLAEAGCLFLSLSGGETLLHPHLDDFVRHARRRRFAVRVKSNGTLLTTSRVARLAEAGAMAVDVSLYGATPKTHDALTLEDGSFDRTIRGLRAVRDAGLRAKASLCLVRDNAGELEEMLALAESLGVEASIDPHVTARYDGTFEPLELRLDRETLKRLYAGPLRHLVDPPDSDPDRSVQCSCARSVCAISATGDVYPCIGAPIPSGNVREKTFAQIWETSPVLRRIRGLVLDDFPACKPCPDRPYCRRSSGVAFAATGDYTGPETWTCMEASVLREIHEEEAAAAGKAEEPGTSSREPAAK